MKIEGRLVAIFFLVLYLLPPIRSYYQFQANVFDFGILLNSTDLISRGQSLFMTTRGLTAWADNQDYFQILLAPLHWLPHSAELLLFAHSLAIWGVGLVLLLVSGPLLACFWWLHPVVLNMNLDLFHTEAFATIFLLGVFLAGRKGDVWWFYVTLVLALFCKEDVALTAGALLLAGTLSPVFKIEQKHLAYGLGIALGVLLTNQLLILPQEKLFTCETLSSHFGDISSGSASPWFSDLGWKLTQWDFYQEHFLSGQALTYVALILWPLAFCALSWFWIVPLPGLLLNLLAGSYLIKGTFHYDHSTLAGILIVALASGSRWRAPLWLAIGSLVLHFTYETHGRMDTIFRREFWQLHKNEQVRIVEGLGSIIPRNAVVSADHTSINYLIKGRNQVYAFPNPFQGHYFGLYGVCDGQAAAMDKLPLPHVVILVEGYNIPEKVGQILDRDYLHTLIKAKEGRSFNVYERLP